MLAPRTRTDTSVEFNGFFRYRSTETTTFLFVIGIFSGSSGLWVIDSTLPMMMTSALSAISSMLMITGQAEQVAITCVAKNIVSKLIRMMLDALVAIFIIS